MKLCRNSGKVWVFNLPTEAREVCFCLRFSFSFVPGLLPLNLLHPFLSLSGSYRLLPSFHAQEPTSHCPSPSSPPSAHVSVPPSRLSLSAAILNRTKQDMGRGAGEEPSREKRPVSDGSVSVCVCVCVKKNDGNSGWVGGIQHVEEKQCKRRR